MCIGATPCCPIRAVPGARQVEPLPLVQQNVAARMRDGQTADRNRAAKLSVRAASCRALDSGHGRLDYGSAPTGCSTERLRRHFLALLPARRTTGPAPRPWCHCSAVDRPGAPRRSGRRTRAKRRQRPVSISTLSSCSERKEYFCPGCPRRGCSGQPGTLPAARGARTPGGGRTLGSPYRVPAAARRAVLPGE